MAAVLEDIVEDIQETYQRETRQGERPLKRLFTLEEFARVVDALPDDCLELIKGEIIMAPPPDFTHIKQTMGIEYLLQKHLGEIEKLGCRVVGSNAWYAVPKELTRQWVDAKQEGPDHVCPDASVCFADYLDTERLPPALLVIETISVSSRSAINRDLVSKPEIYATLQIPTYWVIDRRDKSVWVHTEPGNGQYASRVQYKGEQRLHSPLLEFLKITPAQIFGE
ncbi:MAG TPA: Uma2 family endonuclease [Blastocatellia bacterium]|nr:Uma2 family endonuclease [Blastocatellia bacterium]